MLSAGILKSPARINGSEISPASSAAISVCCHRSLVSSSTRLLLRQKAESAGPGPPPAHSAGWASGRYRGRFPFGAGQQCSSTRSVGARHGRSARRTTCGPQESDSATRRVAPLVGSVPTRRPGHPDSPPEPRPSPALRRAGSTCRSASSARVHCNHRRGHEKATPVPHQRVSIRSSFAKRFLEFLRKLYFSGGRGRIVDGPFDLILRRPRGWTAMTRGRGRTGRRRVREVTIRRAPPKSGGAHLMLASGASGSEFFY